MIHPSMWGKSSPPSGSARPGMHPHCDGQTSCLQGSVRGESVAGTLVPCKGAIPPEMRVGAILLSEAADMVLTVDRLSRLGGTSVTETVYRHLAPPARPKSPL